VQRGDAVVGETTSGTFSPTLRLGIAMAYLDADVEERETLQIDVRGKLLPAEVVRPPFVDADPKR
jgi:aminomethyltransferase